MDSKIPPTFPECVRAINAMTRRLGDAIHPDELEALGAVLHALGQQRTRTSQKMVAVGHFQRAREGLEAAREGLAAGIDAVADGD